MGWRGVSQNAGVLVVLVINKLIPNVTELKSCSSITLSYDVNNLTKGCIIAANVVIL